jgi:predicted phage terminase large subunit-like protein
MHLNEVDLIEIEKEYCGRSLANFARRAWPVLEPATPLAWGWALDAMCEHLEAVSRGEILRLLVNVPPGTMKSLLTSVIWPAWEWGALNQPHLRILGTAHKQELAVRDSTKCRRLIQSEWYQKHWPVILTGDQNAKTKFENDKTGFREAMAFTSMTGARGDRVILDDPHSVDDAASPVKLAAAVTTFREALPSRINNEQSAIVIIMQRLHEADVSAAALELGYEHLCIPMKYEEGRSRWVVGRGDPRKTPDELMFPERFPEKRVRELEQSLGPYATAGQLQQSPVPRGGGNFKREWFNVVRAIPAGTRFVRGWDFAGTEGGGDYTVGAKVGIQPDGRFLIAHIVRGQKSPAGVERMLVNTASQDGRDVKISIPQDPGQAGKSQATYFVKQLAGYSATATPESGDKVTRAEPLAAQAEAGNVDILEGDWNKDFLDEITLFPVGRYDDQVDATSRAFNKLLEKQRNDIIFEAF